MPPEAHSRAALFCNQHPPSTRPPFPPTASRLPAWQHPPVPDLLGQELQAAGSTGLLHLLTVAQGLLQPLQALSQGPIQLLLSLLHAPLVSLLLCLAARGIQHLCRDDANLPKPQPYPEPSFETTLP